jgi:ABC-type sugar transport system ATPase subunit
MSTPQVQTLASDPGGATAALVRMGGIAKAFGPTQALRDASFELLAGEVHALVGENGSGKSTLVKILSGVHTPDTGSIELFGAESQPPATPRAAQALGIVTVFQEVLVAEARSVLDNIWIGIDTPLRARVPTREKRTRARAALEELLEQPLDLDTAVEDLSLSDRQACCIVRALMRHPRVLILDEASSALDVATRDRLFQMVGRLSREGVGVVFITHRMDEISEIGDRITVLRSGETVATLERGKWSPSELVRLMTGSDQLTEHAREQVDAAAARRGEPALSVKGMQLRPGGQPFDVEILAGELVGVAGLEGHGQDDFLEGLRGADTFVAGEIVRHEGGRDFTIRSTQSAAAHGIAYVPRERGQAVFRWMSIRENYAMPTLARDSRGGWLSLGRMRERFGKYVSQLRIVLGSPEDEITTLSGGNQQKVVLARWLAANPRVLALNDPTRGIDIGAKQDLYALLTALAQDGLAVVMLSSEIDEHVELMDRVLVFREHELFREIERKSLSRNSLVSAFFGQSEEGDG